MKILFYANTDWYLFNFRLALLQAVRERGHEVLLVSPAGPYGPKLEAEGFRWHPVPLDRRSLNPLSALHHIVALRGIIRRERPDLVHNFTIKCVVYGSIAAWTTGCASVVNSLDGLGHVFSASTRSSRLLRALVRLCLRASCAPPDRRVIVQNLSDFDMLIGKRIVGQEKAVLIRSAGVDTRRLALVTPEESERPAMVLFASRLLRAKGIVEFVEAAKKLKARRSDCRFVVAGAPDPGSPDAVTREELAEWKSWGCVDFVGHRDDMTELLAQASMVVLVSAYGEGVPSILIEAAACGLPLIASDQAGCREVVEHGVTGLVVPVGNHVALANAVEHLLENPGERRRMGANGRRKAVAEFDMKTVIDQTLRVYRQLAPCI